MTEEISYITFQRTRMIKRGTPNRSDSENSDLDVPQIEWKAMDQYIRANANKCGTSTSTVTAAPKLVSFLDLIGADREKKPSNMLK